MTELSRDPRHIRQRLRLAAGSTGPRAERVKRDLAMLVEAGAMKPVEEWDFEELARGKPRNKRGHFGGPTPAWITPAVQAEARKRFRDKAFNELTGLAPEAVLLLRQIIDGKHDADIKLRSDVAKFVIEQLIGKATAKVELDASPAWQAMLAHALVLPSGEDAHPVVDGQFYEDEDDKLPPTPADEQRARDLDTRRKPEPPRRVPDFRRDSAGFSGTAPATLNRDDPPRHLRGR